MTATPKKATATLKRVSKGVYQRLDKNGKEIKGQYQAKVRIGGVKQTATFDDKDKAKAWVAEREAKILTGQPTNYHDIRKTKLAHIFAEYIKEGNLGERKKQNLARLIIEWGEITLEDFNTRRLRAYLKLKMEQTIPEQPKKKKDHPLFKGGKELVDGELKQRTYSASTVRKYYYDIKTALEWHADINDYQFNSKPFDDNPPPESWEDPRDRRIQGNELERMLNACEKMYSNKQHLKDIILFQIYSCMRIGESLKMRWKDIFLDEKEPWASYIFVPKAHQKSRRHKKIQDREVSMRPELFDLVKKNILPRRGEAKDNDRVFPFWKNSDVFGSRFRLICKNAEVEDFSVHDFRHEGISQLFEHTNLTDIEIAKISGHTEMDTLSRYAKLRPKKTGAKIWASFEEARKLEEKKNSQETVEA